MNFIKFLLGFVVRKRCVAQVTAQFEKQLKMLAQIVEEQEAEKAKIAESIKALEARYSESQNEAQHALRVAKRIEALTE